MAKLEFKFYPSRFYCFFLGATLLASVLIAATLPIHNGIKSLLLAALTLYGVYLFRRFALLKAASSITSIKQLDNNQWQLFTRSGVFTATLRGDSMVTPYIAILRFDLIEKKQLLVSFLFKDSFRDDDYRRLVGMVRMGG
jgi:hypothetical protein